MYYPRTIGNYRIQTVLGSGGFGQVFLGQDPKTLKNFAIKICKDEEILTKEYQILKHLQSIPEILKAFELAEYSDGLYFVIEQLGRTLSYEHQDKILSLECVSAIGYQILSLLEQVHNKDVIHRDIKPSQFLISLDKKTVKLIDFGMATFFRIQGQHKEFKTRCKCRGTVSYASINNHLGFKQSRRDDLESLCYSLLYLAKGSLPWKLNTVVEGFRKWKIVLNQKVSLTEEKLFEHMPAEFTALLKYIKRLCYDQTPNYVYMKSLLAKFINIDQIYSNFDWVDAGNRPVRVRCSQIVEGATVITKLRREKKIMKEREKSRKSLKKKINFRNRFDNIESETFKNKEKDMLERKNNLSGAYDEVFEDNGYKRKKKMSKISKRSCFLQLPTYDIKDFKRTKNKMSAKLSKVRSALELDTREIGDREENELERNKSHEIEKEDSGSGRETPKNGLPEFKNRNLIFEGRKSCISRDNETAEPKCQSF